jgi:hypothetical protein
MTSIGRLSAKHGDGRGVFLEGGTILGTTPWPIDPRCHSVPAVPRNVSAGVLQPARSSREFGGALGWQELFGRRAVALEI